MERIYEIPLQINSLQIIEIAINHPPTITQADIPINETTLTSTFEGGYARAYLDGNFMLDDPDLFPLPAAAQLTLQIEENNAQAPAVLEILFDPSRFSALSSTAMLPAAVLPVSNTTISFTLEGFTKADLNAVLAGFGVRSNDLTASQPHRLSLTFNDGKNVDNSSPDAAMETKILLFFDSNPDNISNRPVGLAGFIDQGPVRQLIIRTGSGFDFASGVTVEGPSLASGAEARVQEIRVSIPAPQQDRYAMLLLQALKKYSTRAGKEISRHQGLTWTQLRGVSCQ